MNYAETFQFARYARSRAATRLVQIALAALLLTKVFVAKAGRARFEHATV